jgi:hypothetical protein
MAEYAKNKYWEGYEKPIAVPMGRLDSLSLTNDDWLRDEEVLIIGPIEDSDEMYWEVVAPKGHHAKLFYADFYVVEKEG